jgi:carboxylesterase type B
MHHLTAFGGSQDPLFKKAIIQSPAFYPAVWDRKGVNEKNFKVFAVAAGCPNQELDCLRSKSVSVVNRAQQKVVVGVPDGSFGFGPAPDGAMVRQLPQLELLTGNYWKGIDSLIVSHMTREADNFISKDPKRASDAYFMNMVNEHFNNNTDVSKALKRQLPLAKFQTPRDRMIQYAQDAVFVCNTRFISQAYQNKTYNFVMEGVHGRDVFANFYSKGGMAERVLADTIGSSQAFKFQRYITSMIRSGNPNTFRSEGSPEWPKGVVAEDIENTLRIGKNFTFFKDSANGADECDIWLDLFAAVTNGGGTYISSHTYTFTDLYLRLCPTGR